MRNKLEKLAIFTKNRASDSCLMLDYVRVINFLLIIIIKDGVACSMRDAVQTRSHQVRL